MTQTVEKSKSSLSAWRRFRTMRRLCGWLALPVLAFRAGASPLIPEAASAAAPTAHPDRLRIAAGTTAVGVAGITAWGVWQWDYFSSTPHAKTEGWFGRNTDDGGMDKLGHLYSAYLLSHAMSALYEQWDFDRDEAAVYGALSSLAVMGYMELGDSFSDYGFSSEDMAMNLVGSLAGYLLYVSPELAEKVDLRWEIGPHPTKVDIPTDYENSKFLLVLKLNGFDRLEETWLRHLELHAGYCTSGYYDDDQRNERHPYAGIGFNLTDLFRRQGHARTATLFRYVQLPYTSLGHEFGP